MKYANTRNKFKGQWRIVEMDRWSEDAINLVLQAFIEFDHEGLGRFQFICVVGYMDCRYFERDGQLATDKRGFSVAL